jgi:hypothetical protein
MAGQGAVHAGDELLRLADVLCAPIIKPLLGKGCVPDDSPDITGGIGLLGTAPSEDALEECDPLLIAKRPEDRDHSGASQLVVSSTRDLDRTDVTVVRTEVQCGHLLRSLVISRLTRITSASAWRSSSAEALRTIDANCRSYFSRSTLAITLNCGHVACSIKDLHGSIEIEKSLPPRTCAVHAGEGPTACIQLSIGCRKVARRGLVCLKSVIACRASAVSDRDGCGELAAKGICSIRSRSET